MMVKKFTNVESEFIESMGLTAQADGFPRIAGRIMGAMILSTEPLSGEELADSLQISRGSVSTNSRLLLTLGVVELKSVPGERKDYYGLADQPFMALFAGQANRSAATAKMVSSAQKKINSPLARKRLAEFARFHQLMAETFNRLQKEFEK